MISKVPDCEYYMSINLLCAVKEQKYTAQLLCNILACTSWIYLTVWMVQALLIAILFNLYAAMRTPNQIIWAISCSSHILTESTDFLDIPPTSQNILKLSHRLLFPYSTWHIWILLAPCLPISIRNLLALCLPVTDLGTESQPQWGWGVSQYSLLSKKIYQVLDRVSRISPVIPHNGLLPTLPVFITSLWNYFKKVNFVLSTLQEPKKEEEDQLGIFQILDRLEAAADNLLSRSVIL